MHPARTNKQSTPPSSPLRPTPHSTTKPHHPTIPHNFSPQPISSPTINTRNPHDETKMPANDTSSQRTSSTTKNSSSNNQSNDKSQYRLIKDAGFDNMNQFMNSYGLKMHDHGDVQEAKAILEGYRKIDEAQRKK
jgi:hypothetical protein